MCHTQGMYSTQNVPYIWRHEFSQMNERNQMKYLTFLWEKNQTFLVFYYYKCKHCWGNPSRNASMDFMVQSFKYWANTEFFLYVSGALRGAEKTQSPIKKIWAQRAPSLVQRHMQSMFIICEFYICALAYSLTFTCNFKISTLVTLCIICHVHHTVENVSHQQAYF